MLGGVEAGEIHLDIFCQLVGADGMARNAVPGLEIHLNFVREDGPIKRPITGIDAGGIIVDSLCNGDALILDCRGTAADRSDFFPIDELLQLATSDSVHQRIASRRIRGKT